MKAIVCTCEQCKAQKNKRHLARKKIKRMINKKRRKMSTGNVYKAHIMNLKFKKNISALAILLLSAVYCQAQIKVDSLGRIFSSSPLGSYSVINNNNGFDFNDCGTWEPQPDYYTDWESVDTLKKIPIKDTIRRWIYSPEKMQISNIVTLEYAPCGNGRPTTWEQERVCELTGIRQKRYRVITYKYIPKPKTEYQKVVDSLSRNSR